MSDTSATKTVHAGIDRGTHHVVLPVPKGHSTFSIAGQWGDAEYGPYATLVSLVCRTRKAGRNSEHRLVRDTTFDLPAHTEQVELKVLLACPGTNLKVTVTTTLPPPQKHLSGAAEIHQSAQARANAR